MVLWQQYSGLNIYGMKTLRIGFIFTTLIGLTDLSALAQDTTFQMTSMWHGIPEATVSAVGLASSAAAAKYNIPFSIDVGVSDKLVQRGLPNVFRMADGYGRIAKDAANNLGEINKATGSKAKTVIIVHEESEFGTGTAKLMTEALKEHNLEVIDSISKSKGVVTATKLFEGQPTLLCEASSLGITSVFPKTGGIAEFYPPNYSFSFEQFNYDDLQKKLELLLSGNQLKEQGISNKMYISKYLNEQGLLDEFEKIVIGSNG